MAVVKRTRGEYSVVLVPTNSNRDLGVFLVFLGLAGTVPVQYFLDWMGFNGYEAFYASVTGFISVLAGIFFIGFARKKYTVNSHEVALTDGYFHKTLRYKWEGSPSIRLRSQEEENGKKDIEYWLVNLVDGKRQYVLDRRVGHQMESRALAEALAKSIDCPVIELSDHGDVTIPREELDLPFAERVRKNPSLLGPELPKPESTTANHWEKDGKIGFSWCLAGSAMLSEFFTVALLLALLALVPLFPEKPSTEHPDQSVESLQRSFLDLARQDHRFEYFIVAGSALALGCFVLFGYRKELSASPQVLVACDRLWGVPIWRAKIPAEQLEEIWVRQSTRGTTLQFISDKCIISGRTSSLESASWLASKMRHYYARA